MCIHLLFNSAARLLGKLIMLSSSRFLTLACQSSLRYQAGPLCYFFYLWKTCPSAPGRDYQVRDQSVIFNNTLQVHQPQHWISGVFACCVCMKYRIFVLLPLMQYLPASFYFSHLHVVPLKSLSCFLNLCTVSRDYC